MVKYEVRLNTPQQRRFAWSHFTSDYFYRRVTSVTMVNAPACVPRRASAQHLYTARSSATRSRTQALHACSLNCHRRRHSRRAEGEIRCTGISDGLVVSAQRLKPAKGAASSRMPSETSPALVRCTACGTHSPHSRRPRHRHRRHALAAGDRAGGTKGDARARRARSARAPALARSTRKRELPGSASLAGTRPPPLPTLQTSVSMKGTLDTGLGLLLAHANPDL